MEYVPGLTLRDLIRKEAPMAPAKALAVIEPVLSALAAAHDAGILHRDVKPENVLLADDGRIKVADFGLSRAINSETQHTATGGVLIGTVSYLAPELVVNGHADARADVYAAGVMIYEMLTGHKPHQADSPIQVAYKHVHQDIPAPSASTPGIPPYVDALVARATSRDTALRPADARVLLHQVRRVRHALDHGVANDEELVADLTPTSPIGDRTPTGELPAQILEPQELAEIAELQHGRPADAVYDQERDVRVVPTRPRTGPPPGPPPAPPRRSRRGPVWLALVVLLAVVAALAGWYFGIARFTVTPGVIDMSRTAAQTKLDQAGLDLKVDRDGVLRDRPQGLRRLHRPGARRPGGQAGHGRGGAVAGVPSGTRSPTSVAAPSTTRSRCSTTPSWPTATQVQRYDEKVPKGRVVTSDPVPGTSLRRDTAVDIVVSKGPRPIAIPELHRQARRPRGEAARHARLQGRHHPGQQRHRSRGPGDLAEPLLRQRHQGRRHHPGRLQGPGARRRCPTSAGWVCRRPPTGCRRPGSRCSVRHASLYVGVMYVVGTDPSGGTKAHKGSTVIVSIV